MNICRWATSTRSETGDTMWRMLQTDSPDDFVLATGEVIRPRISLPCV
jgi:GDP-D-mannose dehydratase